jgi:hypothetical protein
MRNGCRRASGIPLSQCLCQVRAGRKPWSRWWLVAGRGRRSLVPETVPLLLVYLP